jgi:hypothetical protein
MAQDSTARGIIASFRVTSNIRDIQVDLEENFVPFPASRKV